MNSARVSWQPVFFFQSIPDDLRPNFLAHRSLAPQLLAPRSLAPEQSLPDHSLPPIARYLITCLLTPTGSLVFCCPSCSLIPLSLPPTLFWSKFLPSATMDIKYDMKILMRSLWGAEQSSQTSADSRTRKEFLLKWSINPSFYVPDNWSLLMHSRHHFHIVIWYGSSKWLRKYFMAARLNRSGGNCWKWGTFRSGIKLVFSYRMKRVILQFVLWPPSSPSLCSFLSAISLASSFPK